MGPIWYYVGNMLELFWDHAGVIPGLLVWIWRRFGSSTAPAQIRLAAPDAPAADPGPFLPLEEPSSETLLGNQRI